MSLLTMLYLRVNIIIRICLMQNKPFDINEFRIGRLMNYYNVDTKGKRGRQKMSVLFLCLFLYLFFTLRPEGGRLIPLSNSYPIPRET